ncbi:MAG: hypothetical protein E7084_06050 [Bacteroidales bacterium]|nr:hypothetical protein [Bacteroidales bacterium]
MKSFLFFLLQGFKTGGISFFEWLISAAIETIIISLIVGGIAKVCGKDFGEWFSGSCSVVGFIQLIFYVIAVIAS